MARRRMRDFNGRTCVVTGAASGIGRSVAVLLAAEGARLILADLQAEGLAVVAARCADIGGAVLETATFDVSDHEAVAAFGAGVVERHGSPDAVFHVAGTSAWGRPDLLEHSTWRSMVEINLMGTIHVVEAFVPAMMAARAGQLVMVSSAAGLIGLPWHAAYSAAKFGVAGIAEVLRFDLEPYGVGVHLVCPGGVDTPLVETVRISGVDRSDPRIAETVDRFREHAVTPDQAAQSILDGVRRGSYLIYTSGDIRLANLAKSVFPPGYRLAMRLLNRRIGKAAEGMLP